MVFVRTDRKLDAAQDHGNWDMYVEPMGENP